MKYVNFLCPKKIIKADKTGIPEIVDSEDIGILVSPKNPVELSKAILSAIDRKWNTDLLEWY